MKLVFWGDCLTSFLLLVGEDGKEAAFRTRDSLGARLGLWFWMWLGKTVVLEKKRGAVLEYESRGTMLFDPGSRCQSPEG